MGETVADRVGQRVETKEGSAVIAKYNGSETVVLLYDNGAVETTTTRQMRGVDREVRKKGVYEETNVYKIAVKTAKEKRRKYVREAAVKIDRDKYWVDNADEGSIRWLGVEFRINKQMCVVIKCHSIWNVDIMYDTGKIEKNISVKKLMQKANAEIKARGYAVNRCKKGIGRIGKVSVDKDGRERCIIDCENSEYKVQYKDGPIVSAKIK